MFAAAVGHTAALRELLGAGADVDAKDNKGRTARAWAEKGGHTEAADLLREAERGNISSQ